MDQIRDNKPNPKARPTNPRGNTSPTGGGPDEHLADASGRSAESGGAFGKEGHSSRTRGVDSTGKHIAEDERSGLDEDTPRSAVGDPNLTRARKE